MTWIDTTVVIIVVAVGLVILYSALKEPLDLLFGLIKGLFTAAKDKVSDTASGGYEVISYG